jgi:chromate transporter
VAGRWALQEVRATAANDKPQPPSPVGRATGAVLLGLFVLLLLALPLVAAASGSMLMQAVAAFYQAGALVFGGGHVVLPLLQAGVVPPGWVGVDVFLAGYGAAQAVPGPLFSFAAYLGAVMPAPLGGFGGGVLLLGVIFLPAFLLVAGALPFWDVVRRRVGVRSAMAGVNAAVVGVLAGALAGPVSAGAVNSAGDWVLVAVALGLLLSRRVPTLVVLASVAVISQFVAT